MIINTLLKNATQQLKKVSDSPVLDAEILLLHSLNTFSETKSYNRAYLRTWPEHQLEADQFALFSICLNERLKGKPIAYITGFKEFWSLNLQVNENTLIPRADTEILVEQALDLIPENANWNILDLGTGSGAIALAIASERKNCRIYANDRSFSAIAMAKNNALQLNINNCYFFNADWLSAVKNNKFQLIVSNPPYIREGDPHLKQVELQYEPISALTSTANGLNDIEKIIKNARTKLTKASYLLLEHGYDQAKEIDNLFLKYKYHAYAQVKDINQIIRVSIARFPHFR
jgi:release factor glutamine methyltransferase